MRRFVRAILMLFAALPVAAQQLPFNVSIVTVDRSEQEYMRNVFRSTVGRREVVYCVTDWTLRRLDESSSQIIVHKLEAEKLDGRNSVGDVSGLCLDKDNKPLPMIHTHNDGNCQPSVNDIITTTVRDALFDGVQCGEQHVIWLYAWQYKAIAAQANIRQSTP